MRKKKRKKKKKKKKHSQNTILFFLILKGKIHQLSITYTIHGKTRAEAKILFPYLQSNCQTQQKETLSSEDSNTAARDDLGDLIDGRDVGGQTQRDVGALGSVDASLGLLDLVFARMENEEEVVNWGGL